ncbi:hypothetical protein FOL47_005056, partial [Perkinsus chesapeaki]
ARSSISRSLLKSVVDPSLKDALSKALGDRGAFKDQDPIHDSLIEAVLRTRRDFSLPSGLLNGNPPPRKIASRIDGLTDGPRRHVIDQLQRAADTVWLMSVEASTLSQYASGLRSYLFFARVRIKLFDARSPLALMAGPTNLVGFTKGVSEPARSPQDHPFR